MLRPVPHLPSHAPLEALLAAPARRRRARPRYPGYSSIPITAAVAEAGPDLQPNRADCFEHGELGRLPTAQHRCQYRYYMRQKRQHCHNCHQSVGRLGPLGPLQAPVRLPGRGPMVFLALFQPPAGSLPAHPIVGSPTAWRSRPPFSAGHADGSRRPPCKNSSPQDDRREPSRSVALAEVRPRAWSFRRRTIHR